MTLTKTALRDVTVGDGSISGISIVRSRYKPMKLFWTMMGVSTTSMRMTAPIMKICSNRRVERPL